LLAVVGFILPYYFFVSFLIVNGPNLGLLFSQLFANNVLLNVVMAVALILIGCKATPEIVEKEVTREVIVTREVQVQVSKKVEPARVVDVISTSNNTVLVTFSNPMGTVAQDATHYKITRPQLCDVHDWHAQLVITDATLSADRTSVTLTTLSQNGVT
jgi:hypothetical protein